MSVEAKQVAALRRNQHIKLPVSRRGTCPDDKPVVLDLVYREIGGRAVLVCTADPLPPAFLARWQRTRISQRAIRQGADPAAIEALVDELRPFIDAAIDERIDTVIAEKLSPEEAAKYLDWRGR